MIQRVMWAMGLMLLLSVEPSEPAPLSYEECVDLCVSSDEDESMTPEQCEEDCHDSPAFDGMKEI